MIRAAVLSLAGLGVGVVGPLAASVMAAPLVGGSVPEAWALGWSTASPQAAFAMACGVAGWSFLAGALTAYLIGREARPRSATPPTR